MAQKSMKLSLLLAALGGLGIAATMILCFPSPIQVIMGIDRFRVSLPSMIGVLVIALIIYACFYAPNKGRDKKISNP